MTTRCAASPLCDRRRAAEAAARNRAATSASGLILAGGVASGRGDLYLGASMSPLSDMETTVTAEDIVTLRPCRGLPLGCLARARQGLRAARAEVRYPGVPLDNQEVPARRRAAARGD